MCGLSWKFSFSTHGCCKDTVLLAVSGELCIHSVCYDLHAIQPLDTLQRILGGHADAQHVCHASQAQPCLPISKPVEEPLQRLLAFMIAVKFVLVEKMPQQALPRFQQLLNGQE